MTETSPQNTARRNSRILLGVFAVVTGMIVLSFASVPLYNVFCRVTGFGGTTQVATEEQAPVQILERRITVKFNGDIASDLPWEFKPDQREITIHVGQQTKISYSARSETTVPTGGTAMFNVTPDKAGKYFHKIQCFCFAEQVLKPGERVVMPVLFYIDPAIAEDRNLDDVKTITLSYSFFKSESEALEQALEDFYNQPSSAAENAEKNKSAF